MICIVIRDRESQKASDAVVKSVTTSPFTITDVTHEGENSTHGRCDITSELFLSG